MRMRVFAAPPSNPSSNLVPFSWPPGIIHYPSLFLDIALSDTQINPLKIKRAVAKDCTCTHKGINGICTH